MKKNKEEHKLFYYIRKAKKLTNASKKDENFDQASNLNTMPKTYHDTRTQNYD